MRALRERHAVYKFDHALGERAGGEQRVHSAAQLPVYVHEPHGHVAGVRRVVAVVAQHKHLALGNDDRLPDLDEELSAALPKATILHGDGTNEAFLRESGIEQCDAFAALTGIDEENVLMGLYVRKTWPKVKVVTKINRYSFQTIIDAMDIGSVFNPRFSTSNLICRYVRSMQDSAGSKIETLYKLVGGKAEALEFRVTESSTVCGVPLLKLELRPNLLVCCINRGGQILIPSGQDTIEPGDTVVVVSSTPGLRELDDILAGHRGYGHE